MQYKAMLHVSGGLLQKIDVCMCVCVYVCVCAAGMLNVNIRKEASPDNVSQEMMRTSPSFDPHL